MVQEGNTGAVLWQGAASYTVRAARAGVAERAVGLPGLGELHVGVGADDTACRLVWSRGGIGQLVLYVPEQGSCATRDGGRICVSRVRFRIPGAEATRGAQGPARDAPPDLLVVDGCADANDLLWGKVDGPAAATVGPRPWRERCVPIPAARGCAPTFLARDDVRVHTNPAAHDSFRFHFDDERWHACFLEAESGPYALRLRVRDSCGRQERVELMGHSAELDD